MGDAEEGDSWNAKTGQRRHARDCCVLKSVYKGILADVLSETGGLSFFQDRACGRISAVGAMVFTAGCPRYAKWLLLLRRRVCYKSVRVGRIHKLWPVPDGAWWVVGFCLWGWLWAGGERRRFGGGSAGCAAAMCLRCGCLSGVCLV